MSTIKDIMHGYIGDTKEITLVTHFYSFENNNLFNLVVQVLHLTEHGFYNLRIGVHDWRVTVIR